VLSTTYHPQTHGQTERVNKVLDDMLMMHVTHHPKEWEQYLPLVKFTYNNGYQESLTMSPFEVLYGKKCRVPISWNNPVDKITLGPKLLKEMEHAMINIRQNLKVVQDR
jgi:hypothetical protein